MQASYSPFDRMVIGGIEKLIAQGEPGKETEIPFSTSYHTPSRYRTTTGLCCLIGCMIPDDRYRRKMEEMSAPDVIAEARPDVEMGGREKEALNFLRLAHDDNLGKQGRQFMLIMLKDAVAAANAAGLADLEDWIGARRDLFARDTPV